MNDLLPWYGSSLFILSNHPDLAGKCLNANGETRKSAIGSKSDAQVVYPLHYAAHECDAARVVALLAAGANPASLSLAGWTVFHEALAAGDCDVVSIVVDAFNSKYTASYALKASLIAI